MTTAENLFSVIGSATSNFFSSWGSFFLNDVLSPLIIIALVVLLFWGQYKLIMFYVFLGGKISPFIGKVVNVLVTAPKVKKLVNSFKSKLSLFNEK